VLEIDVVELVLNDFVPLIYVVHLLRKLDEKVQSVDEAAFERMNVLLAVEAKLVLAMLAAPSVIILINRCD